MGEAIRQLTREDPTLAEELPGRREIIAFRNVLAHGYAQVDDGVVWSILRDDVPALKTVVARLLGGIG